MDDFKENEHLKKMFDDAIAGKIGVMPFDEFTEKLVFVWHNGKGYGRVSEMILNKEGRNYALERMKEIEARYKEVTKRASSHD